ncbi:B-cell receptor-associated protein 31 [Cherax quadricarinatus]|nr:B-cell receptor-associated protein 31-like [Cherax quadricarinatus]XP_053636842.1 B-cell receptor-associated protein 31-like [Cherax quadricarinatus]
MSIQWTLIAGVMYVELAVTILLLIPVISPSRWHSIFKSRFLRSIGNMSHIYFKVFLLLLSLFFLDAIREMRKYSNELSEQGRVEHGIHLDAEMQAHMRLFRAQRNFYISGFSLFLWVVLQRLTTLISRLAVAMAEGQAALKQAKSASETAAQLLKQDKAEKEEDQQKEANVSNEIKELMEEKLRLEAERDAALKQAQAVGREYDRMLEEHSKLQEELKKASGVEESKKDD